MRLKDNDLLVVLTVGSFLQKHLCEKTIAQLDLSVNNIKVVCDDEFGIRVGSAGALLKAVEQYYDDYKRIIIINCGGFSKRTINCAIKGKAFAQTLVSGEPITLFEHILNNIAALSECFSEGVIVACSDILVNSDNIRADFSNCVAFGIYSDLKTASQHGVMIKNEKNELVQFLHKEDVSVLKEYVSAECEQIIVDTGMAFLNDLFVRRLLEIVRDKNILDIIKESRTELNFYSDILPLLSRSIKYSDYIGAESEESAIFKIKNILYDYLSDINSDVYVAQGQPFLHFGNNEQLRNNTLKVSDKSEKHLKINSYVKSGSKIGCGTVLDNVCLRAESDIGEGCLISDIKFNFPITVNNNKVICGFRLNDGSFVTVMTDIKENPKELENGTELWDVPRFYKAQNFDDSFKKLVCGANEEKVSLAFCVENADYDYFLENKQYISGLTRNIFQKQYSDMRENIISQYFSKKSFPIIFVPCCDCVEVSMPVRLNLSGTWTDAMPYCVDNGGAVVNVAVKTDDMLPINVRLEKLDESAIEFSNDGVKSVFSFDDAEYEDDFSDFNLHKAVLKTLGINQPEKLSAGFRLNIEVKKIDKGSGLGTSSILLAACFRAFSKMYNLNYTDSDIVEMVFVAEQLMKTGGGWQDQAGSLFPGMKLVSSTPGIPQNVKTETIELPEIIQEIFAKKAVLMPTGQRHFGRFIVNDVANRYLDRNPKAISAYSQMKDLNKKLTESIKNGDVKGFYSCINTHRELLKLISPLTTTAKTDSITEMCLSVAEAVSICGAGGGGYLLVFLKDNVSADDFKLFVSQKFPEIKSEVLKTEIYIQGEKNEQ